MMSVRRLLTIALSITTASAWAGNISGKIAFAGKAPKPETVSMSTDPECQKLHKTPVTKQEIVVNDGGLANVFVYVKEGLKPEAISKDVPGPVTVDQSGCVYVPRVIGVRVGQTLRLVNSDATLHNVSANAKVNSKFNVGMPTKGQVVEKKFTKPEVMVRLKCDVHNWMAAWVGVVDHPFFAVSDPHGAFTIPGLPAGEYTLEAWHEKLGTQTTKVKVTETGMSTASFSFGDHKG